MFIGNDEFDQKFQVTKISVNIILSLIIFRLVKTGSELSPDQLFFLVRRDKMKFFIHEFEITIVVKNFN